MHALAFDTRVAMLLRYEVVKCLCVPTEDLDYCEGFNLLDLSIKMDTTHTTIALLSLETTTGGNV